MVLGKTSEHLGCRKLSPKSSHIAQTVSTNAGLCESIPGLQERVDELAVCCILSHVNGPSGGIYIKIIKMVNLSEPLLFLEWFIFHLQV